MGTITAPSPLNPNHDTEAFNCGESLLDDWLKKSALKNEKSGASRTFVIGQENRVIGYYALATGCVERIDAPKNISRNMPDPIPVIILARLAVDKDFQEKRLGGALLRDAMIRTLNVTEQVGVRSLLVHAISDEAKDFYLRYSFQVSTIDPMTLFLSINELKKAL